MRTVLGGIAAAAALLAPMGCSSGGSGDMPENVGEIGQALAYQPFYLKNQNLFCRVTAASGTAGQPTSRAGLIKCDLSTSTGAHSFMKIPSGGNFRFQVATGPNSVGMYVARTGSPSRMSGNMYVGLPLTETNCGNGSFAYQEPAASMMAYDDTGIRTSAGTGCGNATSEWTWVANGSSIEQPTASAASTNTNAPATYFSTLTTARQWKMTLPVDLFGSGAPTDIYENELPNWYHSDYFYAANNWMVFKAPNEGITTSGSVNARSELREMLRFGDGSITDMASPSNNWGILSHLTGSTFARIGGKLNATLRVDKVFAGTCSGTSTAAWSTVIGQIHGNTLPAFDDSGTGQGGFNNSTVRIHYKKFPSHAKGSVYWLYQNNWAKGDSRRVDKCYPVWGTCPGVADGTSPANGIALGEDFSYEIEVAGNTQNVKFTRPAGTPALVTFSMNLASTGIANDNPDGWKYDSLYFKAGNYNQSNTTTAGCAGGGMTTAAQYAAGHFSQVTFKALTVGASGTTAAVCGNSIVQSPEACDDGNTVTEACAYGLTSCTVCSSTCTNVAGAVKRCGDTVVQSANGEQCDDGNTTNTDACSNICKTPTCSDGIKNGTESSTDCGGVSGGVTCAACTAAVCGNNIVQSPEACDDGNTVTEACAYGLTSCTVCSSTCTNVAGAVKRCGDTVVQTANGEQCDDGNTVNTDACSNICKTPTCSDTIKNQSESAVDCGGSGCALCATGMTCTVGTSCSSGICTSGLCAAAGGAGTTYQAETLSLTTGYINGSWVEMEDGAPQSMTKTGSVAGSSVTVRYMQSATNTAKLSLYINGAFKAQTAAPSATAADLTFAYAVPAGATVEIRTDGSYGFNFDYIKINP